MRKKTLVLSVGVMILLIGTLIVAGCTGPSGSSAPQSVTSPTPALPMVKITKVTPTPQTIAVQEQVNEAMTCTQRGGFLTVAGQRCPGTWLIAANTYSCCSQEPVRVGTGNTTITTESFDIIINFNDDLGDIIP